MLCSVGGIGRRIVVQGWLGKNARQYLENKAKQKGLETWLPGSSCRAPEFKLQYS
jgi:hypothetical protein